MHDAAGAHYDGAFEAGVGGDEGVGAGGEGRGAPFGGGAVGGARWGGVGAVALGLGLGLWQVVGVWIVRGGPMRAWVRERRDVRSGVS